MELMKIYRQAMATWTLLRTKFADGLEAVLHLWEGRRSWEGELEHTTREGQCITVQSRIVLVRETEHARVKSNNNPCVIMSLIVAAN